MAAVVVLLTMRRVLPKPMARWLCWPGSRVHHCSRRGFAMAAELEAEQSAPVPVLDGKLCVVVAAAAAAAAIAAVGAIFTFGT